VDSACSELIVAERECCPFLTFEVIALPNRGPLLVRVTGPDGTKEFLRTLLGKPEDRAARVPPPTQAGNHR
jgi:hypothetical protein